MISEPGVYAITDAEYHADPCAVPSLSSSIAKVLIDRTPMHAWYAHPRLNPRHRPERRRDFDRGTAAHALLLGGDTGLHVIEAPDFRKKETQKERDGAYAAGRVPILAREYAAVQAMAKAARVQLDQHEEAHLFAAADCEFEKAVVWQDGGVWCRGKFDALNRRARCIWDLKTTSKSASPTVWQKRAFALGCQIQEGFYRRGALVALDLELAAYRLVVQEQAPPYALSVVALTPEAVALGAMQVNHARDVWRSCLSSGVWPSYPLRTAWLDLPGYVERDWMEREMREEEAA